MKRLFSEYVPGFLLLAILGLIVLHAPMTVVVATYLPDIAVGFKAWKEVLMALAAVCIAVEVTRRGLWRVFAGDRLFWVLLAYIALHIATVLVTPLEAQAEMAGLGIDLRYIVYFCLVYSFLKLHPQYYRSFVAVGIVGAGIVMGFALMQQVLPRDTLKHLGYDKYTTIAPYMTVDQNPDYIRINSTLRGPNPLGAYAVMVLAGVVAYVLYRGKSALQTANHKLLYGLLLVGGVVALWTSYSRSALVAGMVAVGVVVAVHFRRYMTARVWAGIAAGLVLVTGLMFAARETAFVRNVIFHDSSTSGAEIDSNQEHFDSLEQGLERMASQPVGAGVGSTGSASLFGDNGLIIENQYLMIAHEAGWLGLVLFLVIYLVVLWRLWAMRRNWLASTMFASGVGLALIGLLLPVWADDTVSIVWWGMAAVVLSSKRRNHGKPTDQKAKRTA